MNLYEQYKPFRNYMRRFETFPSLVNLWAYSNHIVGGAALPAGFAAERSLDLRDLRNHLYAWDLELLAREVILNSRLTSGDLDLRRWKDIAIAVNHIRRIDEYITEALGPNNDVILELHRIAHRQFKWQAGLDMAAIVRVLKIYGAGAVEALVLKEMGMTTQQFVRLGAAIAGNFMSKFGMSTTTDYAVLAISREVSAHFFQCITCDIDTLREQIVTTQSYDEDWLYAWNPLERYPLIAFNAKAPDQVICPIPRYVLARATTGLFFDVVKSKGFDNPYGDSFQKYIGEVLSITCKPPQFNLRAEEEYRPTKANRKDGADWILSDATGHLVVECKAKRLSLEAKTLGDDLESLEKDLKIMAHAITQNYKNIQDVLAGLANWSPDGLPLYPLIVTLEDWYLFNPRIRTMLDSHVRNQLRDAKVDETVLDKMPYTIASARELEAAAQIIAKVGICVLMKRKTALDLRQAALFPFLQTQFPVELKAANALLFADEARRLIPDNPASPRTV